MTLSFLLSTVGGLTLIFIGKNELLIMTFMLLTRFGINICFTLCYIINAEYFPSIVCSGIFGICNIFSRISTVFSPLIAEIHPPVPMIIFILVCSLSTVSSMFLKRNEQAEEAMRDLDDTLSQHSRFASSFMGGKTKVLNTGFPEGEQPVDNISAH
mmetsp:Transcript_6148/g.9878  ORF Transcript_6148/g.9878 Transcript_6148/m.9878 type:complete len:156 (+) Transcript_6148:1800-2267(+)